MGRIFHTNVYSAHSQKHLIVLRSSERGGADLRISFKVKTNL